MIKFIHLTTYYLHHFKISLCLWLVALPFLVEGQTVSCLGQRLFNLDSASCEILINPESFGDGGDIVLVEGLPEYAMNGNGTSEVTIHTDLIPEFIVNGAVHDLTYSLLVGTLESPTNSCWGTFIIQDIYFSGCSAVAPPGALRGYVFNDENANNLQDGSEQGIPGVKIINERDSAVVFTNQEGFYFFGNYDGFNTFTMLGVQGCNEDEQEFSVNFDSINSLPTHNFPINTQEPIIAASPSLISGFTRCGFTVPFYLNISNEGCQLLSGSARLEIDNLVSPIGSSQGLTYEVNDLAVNSTYRKKIFFKIANEEFVGDSIRIKVVFKNDELEEVFEYTSEIRCAIDPNDKMVEPVVADTDSVLYSLFEDEVIYKIRFQNEGNDTAFNIRIEDTLSNHFDITTLRPISASHEYSIEVNDRNALEYNFRDILLPYKTIDEPGSQGYFTFGIIPKAGLSEFTRVENTAFIYFDFNKPVITNTVKHTFVTYVDEDQDGFYFWEDCNDRVSNININAEDIPYNGVDENCDGVDAEIDEDGDGFNTLIDCNDQDALINPDIVDIPYNNIDENCDGQDAFIDEDNDSFNSLEDCNDLNADINPDAEDIPYNDIDENCDGEDAVIDNDMDGFNSLDDCDDQNANINPSAEDIPYNDIDENCDGSDAIIDEDGDGFNSLVDCNDLDAAINPDAEEFPNNDVDENCDGEILIIDQDGDGFNSTIDCNDIDPNINPDAADIPYNDIDENCDGLDSEIDEDSDGFNSLVDCNDLDSLINPLAVDIPDNDIDENCDGVDEMSSSLKDPTVDELLIFPNPSNHSVFVQNSSGYQFKVELRNINGNLMQHLPSKVKVLEIDVQNYPPGIYFLKVIVEDLDKIIYHKLVISR